MNATRIVLTIACLTATTAGSTTAAPRFWKNSASSWNWSVNTNWSGVSAAGADTVAAPANGDTVSIAPTTDVARTITYNVPALSLVSLTVDLPVAGTNRTTFTMPAAPANSLTLTSGFIVGNAGRATFNQLSGTVNATSPTLDSVVGLHPGSNGIYNLSGGSLSVGHDLVVGTLGNSSGQFNQSGGTVNVASTLRLGSEANSTGTYIISNAATLSAGPAIVGGNGTGTLSVTSNASVNVGNLNIGSLGTVNLDGGSLRFSSLTRQGPLNFNSGSVVVAGPATLESGSVLSQLFSSFTAAKNVTIEGGAGEVGAIINDFPSGLEIRGGTFTSLKKLQVGSNGNGFMRIDAGGTVFSSDTDIGAHFGQGTSEGTVFVEGVGSTWNNSGDLVVGANNSSGRLLVANGARVNVGETLSIGPGDSVTLAGGTIRFKNYGREDSGDFFFQHGTIEFDGNHTIGLGFPIPDLFGGLPTVPAGKGLTIDGVATIATALTIAGGTFRANGLNVGSGASLDFDRGVLELTGGTITGLAHLTVPTSGEFRAAGVQSLRVTGAAGSTITATGNLTLGNAAAVNGFGTQGTLAIGANTVTLLDANEVVFDSLALATLGSGANAGTLNAANGLTLDFGGNITGFGTVSTPNNIAKPLINNGHITGNSPAQCVTLPGYVKGVGTFDNVNFTGTFSPGLSPTILTVGNIALTNTSTLIMELGGTAAGSGYDQLQSAGTLAFDGTLQISLINGFSPTAGQSFNLFDFTTAMGTFDTLQLPTLAGLAWNTSQLYTNGIISLAAAGLPGDYNQNGIVDAADYSVWRDNLGSSLALPNDDTAGVGQDDYLRWKQNFGVSSGSGQLATVPEPSCLLLFVAATSFIAANQGSRRSPARGRT